MIVLLGFSLGIVLGSFVKALADRSLSNKSFWGRSYCLNCKKKLQWYDLFPILSYLTLQGRCRYCGKKIGLEYLVVEISMGILVGFLFWQNLINFQFLISASEGGVNYFHSIINYQLSIFIIDLLIKIFFISVLVALVLTDLKKMLIPDRIILPAITLGFIMAGLLAAYKIGYLYYHLLNHPVGKYLLFPHSDYFGQHALELLHPFLTGVFSALLIGGFFYLLIIITKGKGMGGGDVKLGAFIGLMLGFPNSLVALILAFFSGAIVSILLLASGRKKIGQVIPFGPFLVIGALIALFWGDKIFNWYIKLGS
ncbi:prepilin peptidase [Candidatus Daviesbacteria bacterium]|nr:prepilin peptidase [Candidatus Daviesbacteria bacterium]